ncbi:MAG: hypothetical protein RR367_11145, partial [Clostridia bacterium]
MMYFRKDLRNQSPPSFDARRALAFTVDLLNGFSSVDGLPLRCSAVRRTVNLAINGIELLIE